ncbi:MAG: helix-turn-helix domain-containing protein [Pseudomonadota bacterium]
MADPTFVSRSPSRALNGLVSRISGYVSKTEPSVFLETAELVFPLVFNLGKPWDIQLGMKEGFDRNQSFVAGLFPGPVRVSCDAGAELLQVDVTPLGAARLFGGAAADLAGHVVDLKSIAQFSGDYDAIHDQLYSTTDWVMRFDLIEELLAPRFKSSASKQIHRSWHLLSTGNSIAQTAAELGWSTRHLSAQFRKETGIKPITAARMLRFQRARSLALQSKTASWAEIAAAAGYSDQAHLVRSFRDLSGETPTAWARSARPSAPRLHI